jgi:hypothetical protein
MTLAIRSAEEHHKNKKNTCDPYLGLGLLIYIKNSAIHPVSSGDMEYVFFNHAN